MNPTQTMGSQVPRPKSPTSVGQVFVLVAGFLALAAIGATLGWTLTDTSGPSNPIAASSLSPGASTHPSGSAAPSKTSSTPPAPLPGLRVPDFAANHTRFQDARQQLMAQKVQAYLVFLGGNGGDAVVRSNPPAGSRMHKGDTVKLYMDESAPLLDVPNEIHKNCKAAGSDVSRVGFRTAYASGKDGVVTDQTPEPNSGNSHWNDTITLTCGSPTTTKPSTSASPDPPASPDPSPSD